MKPPFISIVIPLDNIKYIDVCMKSIFRTSYQDFEVIVVSDGLSGKDFASLRKILSKYRVQLFSLPNKMGCAYARNVGARHAKGDILVFTDGDIILKTNTLEKIKDKFISNPNIDALFGLYDQYSFSNNYLSNFKNLTHRYVHLKARKKAFTFWTGCGAVRKDVFDKLGGFNSGWTLLSDIELGNRMVKNKYVIYIFQDLEVIHCKKYSLFNWIRRELLGRSITWTKIILKHKIFQADMNLKWNNIVSTGIALCLALVLGFSLHHLLLLPITFILLLALLAFNIDLLIFLKRNKGLLFSIMSSVFVFLYYLFSGIGFLTGVFSYFIESVKVIEEKG